MTRDFYFLKDSVSGQFYTGQNEYMSDFRNAAVYHTEKSAVNHIKGITQSWEHHVKYPTEEKYREEFEKTQRPWPNDMVKERRNLFDWGIVVVKGTVKI
jgi:NADH:ubiquinone oxidoreductase subunit